MNYKNQKHIISYEHSTYDEVFFLNRSDSLVVKCRLHKLIDMSFKFKLKIEFLNKNKVTATTKYQMKIRVSSLFIPCVILITLKKHTSDNGEP